MAQKNLPHEIINFLLAHYSDLNEYTLLNNLVEKKSIGKTEKIKAAKFRSVL